MNRATDPELWSNDLDFLLRQADAALGLRGTTGAVVTAIERGGGPAGLEDASWGMLRRIGWREDGTEHQPTRGPVERVRRLRARWVVLPDKHVRVAMVHYLPRNSRDAVEQQLGFCAAASILLAPDPKALLRACERPTALGSRELRAAAVERGERGVRAMHRAWYGLGEREALRALEA